MKFDVIVTNPPFQDSVNRKKTPHKLWIDFTVAVFDRLLRDGGYLCQVSPASFASPSNVVLEHMKHFRTLVLRLDTESFFPDVGSSFSDYLIQKVPTGSFATQIFTRSDSFEVILDAGIQYLPNDLSRLAMSIHDKVMFRDRPKLKVEWDYVTCHNIRRKSASPTLTEEQSPSFPFPVFHTNRSTWWSSIRQEWATVPKVMWSRSGYTKPFFDGGVLGGTDMAYFVRVDGEAQGLHLAHNLNLLLMRYIYKTAKWSGFGNERVFASLPALPTDRALADAELFDLFALTPEEVSYVVSALEGRKRQT